MTQEFITRLFGAMMNIKKTHLVPEYWSPSSDGEISFEVRKWFEKNEPEVWEDYLDSFYSTVGYYEWLGIDGTTSVNIFNAQLSIDNFYNYLIEHFGEWGYKDGICKYPEAEKIIKGDN